MNESRSLSPGDTQGDGPRDRHGESRVCSLRTRPVPSRTHENPCRPRLIQHPRSEQVGATVATHHQAEHHQQAPQ